MFGLLGYLVYPVRGPARAICRLKTLARASEVEADRGVRSAIAGAGIFIVKCWK